MTHQTITATEADTLLVATLEDANRPITLDEIRRASGLSKAAADGAVDAMLASGALICGTRDDKVRAFMLPEWVPGLEWVPARRRWRKRKVLATPAEAEAAAAAFLAALHANGWPMWVGELKEATGLDWRVFGDALALLKASRAVVWVEARWRQPYLALPEQVAAWERSDFAYRPGQRRPRSAAAKVRPHA